MYLYRYIDRPLFQINYGTPAAPQHRARLQTRFSFNEDFILTSDEITCSILVFDTRTQELSQRLSGHNQVVRYVTLHAIRIRIATDGAALLDGLPYHPPILISLLAVMTIVQGFGMRSSNTKCYPTRCNYCYVHITLTHKSPLQN